MPGVAVAHDQLVGRSPTSGRVFKYSGRARPVVKSNSICGTIKIFKCLKVIKAKYSSNFCRSSSFSIYTGFSNGA